MPPVLIQARSSISPWPYVAAHGIFPSWYEVFRLLSGMDIVKVLSTAQITELDFCWIKGLV